jgi:hypothetical protein
MLILIPAKEIHKPCSSDGGTKVFSLLRPTAGKKALFPGK